MKGINDKHEQILAWRGTAGGSGPSASGTGGVGRGTGEKDQFTNQAEAASIVSEQ